MPGYADFLSEHNADRDWILLDQVAQLRKKVSGRY